MNTEGERGSGRVGRGTSVCGVSFERILLYYFSQRYAAQVHNIITAYYYHNSRRGCIYRPGN